MSEQTADVDSLPPPSASGTSSKPFLVLVLAVYVLGILCYFNYGFSGLKERDGYFHARYANLLPEHGLSRTFDWTQASTWNGRFCDKEFLYHVLMVPFATSDDDPVAGVHIFAVLVSFGLILALYLVLRSLGTPWPHLFAFLPTCMGALFFLRAIQIRSHTLSMILAVIGIYLLVRRKWWALGALGFIYAWSYTFPMVLLMFAVPYMVGRWFAGGGWDWKGVLIPLAGVLTGLIIHPYTPLTLETFLTYIQVLSIGANMDAVQLELGYEIYAKNSRELLIFLPLYQAVTFGLLIAGWRIGKRASAETVGVLCVAVFWYFMTMFYARFTEYGIPLLILALGLVVRDVIRDGNWRELLPKRAQIRYAGMAFVAIILVASHAHTLKVTHDVHRTADPRRFTGAATWMAENLQPAETVVNLWWGEFPDLYYDGYRQRFIWGLDPTYTARYEREGFKRGEIARTLEDMRTLRRHIDPRWLSQTFNARVLVMGHAQALRFPALVTGKWDPVYADRTSVIFALRGPHGPPEGFTPPPYPIKAKGPFAPRSIRLEADRPTESNL